MKVIGIDIGSYSIKIAEVLLQGKSVEVLEFSEHLLSQTQETDKDLELITTLKEILRKYEQEPLKDLKFVMGIPQDKVSLRSLEFPFKEKFKILKSLPFELEDLTPFSFDEAIFDAKLTSTTKHTSQILGVAAPKDLIKETLNLAHDVQLDPDVISLNSLALNNLFEELFEAPPVLDFQDHFEEETEEEQNEGEEKTQPSLIQEDLNLTNGESILNIGHTSSILIVRSQNTLQTIRHINWGAQNLVQSIAKTYNLQHYQAFQKLKASNGFLLSSLKSTAEEVQFADVMSKELAQLGRIINLTLLEVKGTHKTKITGMGLMGGFSAMKNIGPKLTETIQIPCNKILKLKAYPQINIQENKNSELSMAVALGLALEGCKKSVNPAVNFRKQEFKKEKSGLKDAWSQWGFYVNLAAASIAVFFIYAYLRSSISEELAFTARRNMRSAAQSVFKIKKSKASESKLKNLLKDLKTRETAKSDVASFTSQAPSPLKLFKKISERAGSRLSFPVNIEKLNLSKQKVEITGETTKYNEFKKFSKKLAKLSKGKIKESVSKIQIGEQEGVRFVISFKPKKGAL